MSFFFPDHRDTLMTQERLSQGYVIVLPGIEGRSFWNQSILNGLIDAEIPYAIDRHDWTMGRFRFLHNLRSSRRHDVQSQLIANKIARYRENHPTQPVHLIGHSGGGAMALMALQNLPEGIQATGAVLLANAMSPQFDLSPVLQKTTTGIWNFTSYLDLFFLAFGTITCGTIDGKHSLSAGLTGFDRPETLQSPDITLREVPYRLEFARDRNFAGHFGCTARPFVKKWVAPLLKEIDPQPVHLDDS